jgi:hypothetical protein
MPLLLPDIPEAERTPLVEQLLDIIALQQERIQQLEERVHQLEDEILRLKGLKARPRIAPSSLESPPRPPRDPNAKRPGSAKRSKTARLTITEEVLVPLADRPDEAVFKGYEDFVVQDLILKPRVIRYRRERWLTPDGRSLVAPLPADVLPGSHYGPDLICHILHQYHHQHVTQPLLLEELHQLGIDISAGELNRILTEKNEAFHQEKAELLPAALAVSDYVQVDGTGARHQGHNGACTQIGNELFASFASTESKSRLNFLELLRQPHTDYVSNETANGLLAAAEAASGGAGPAPAGSASVRGHGRLAGTIAGVGDHPGAARADRQRRGVAGEPDRSWGLAGVGDPQRRSGAVRRPGACGLLAPCGTAVGATDPLQ